MVRVEPGNVLEQVTRAVAALGEVVVEKGAVVSLELGDSEMNVFTRNPELNQALKDKGLSMLAVRGARTWQLRVGVLDDVFTHLVQTLTIGRSEVSMAREMYLKGCGQLHRMRGGQTSTEPVDGEMYVYTEDQELCEALVRLYERMGLQKDNVLSPEIMLRQMPQDIA